MQKIINFFITHKNFLLFLSLFFVSVFLTIQSHSYHTNKFVHSANRITGTVYLIKNEITGYFGLRKQNELLLKENAQLQNQIQLLTPHYKKTDSLILEADFIFYPAEVINNNYSKINNHLTIKAGSKSGIESEMGVVTANGIVGIVDQVSSNFVTVMSVLHSKSSISVMLKKSGHFGSLVWNGKNPNELQLIDIARLAPVKIGDTVTTDGRSTIFPKGINVGTVTDFTLDQTENFYIINVALFHDMTSTQQVYIIKNTKAEEIKELEKLFTDE